MRPPRPLPSTGTRVRRGRGAASTCGGSRSCAAGTRRTPRERAGDRTARRSGRTRRGRGPPRANGHRSAGRRAGSPPGRAGRRGPPARPSARPPSFLPATRPGSAPCLQDARGARKVSRDLGQSGSTSSILWSLGPTQSVAERQLERLQRLLVEVEEVAQVERVAVPMGELGESPVVLDEAQDARELAELRVDGAGLRVRADREQRDPEPEPEVVDLRRRHVVVEAAVVVPRDEDRGVLPELAPHHRVHDLGRPVLAVAEAPLGVLAQLVARGDPGDRRQPVRRRRRRRSCRPGRCAAARSPDASGRARSPSTPTRRSRVGRSRRRSSPTGSRRRPADRPRSGSRSTAARARSVPRCRPPRHRPPRACRIPRTSPAPSAA